MQNEESALLMMKVANGVSLGRYLIYSDLKHNGYVVFRFRDRTVQHEAAGFCLDIRCGCSSKKTKVRRRFGRTGIKAQLPYFNLKFHPR